MCMHRINLVVHERNALTSSIIPRGVHPPWGNDAFPSVSDFPLFPKNFLTPWKISKFYIFPKDFPIFIRQNFWWPSFLVIDHKFRFPSLFSLFQYFSPYYFDKIILCPYFYKFSLCFRQIYVFLHTLYSFRFPLLLPWCIYSSHNARTGRPWLFLDR